MIADNSDFNIMTLDDLKENSKKYYKYGIIHNCIEISEILLQSLD